MAVVLVPSQWRAVLGGQRRLNVEAATVGDLLQALLQRWPDLKPWLDNGLGGLPEYLNIYVGDTDIRVLQELGTPLRPDDEVSFIFVMAGGSSGEEGSCL